MTKDPNSYIQASAETLAETLLSKNSDYAPTGEFSNFEKAEEISGVRVMQIINAQIAIKMTRLQSLWLEHEVTPKNESIQDTYLDLAGYAVIAHAYLEYLSGDKEEPEFDYVIKASRNIEDPEQIRNIMEDHAHQMVTARGEMDEPLDYLICGTCGVRR